MIKQSFLFRLIGTAAPWAAALREIFVGPAMSALRQKRSFRAFQVPGGASSQNRIDTSIAYLRIWPTRKN